MNNRLHIKSEFSEENFENDEIKSQGWIVVYDYSIVIYCIKLKNGKIFSGFQKTKNGVKILENSLHELIAIRKARKDAYSKLMHQYS